MNTLQRLGRRYSELVRIALLFDNNPVKELTSKEQWIAKILNEADILILDSNNVLHVRK